MIQHMKKPETETDTHASPGGDFCTQNEPIHTNMHKKYSPEQVKWEPLHTPTHTDPPNTHQRTPQTNPAQQRAEPHSPYSGSRLEQKEKYSIEQQINSNNKKTPNKLNEFN